MTESPSKAVARYDGPRSIGELQAYAQLLAVNTTPDGRAWRNDALPATFRGNPAAVAFAVEYAKALDVSPVTALIGIHIVDGKPTASAGLISALVRRSGHKIRTWIEGSIAEGTAKGITTITRADDAEFEYRSEWTLDRAVRAGLMNRTADGRVVAAKPKSAWATYPENMLKSRSITECSRDAAEDAILGVHYTPEELGVEVDESGEPVYTVTTVAEQVAYVPSPTPAAAPEAATEEAATEKASAPEVNLDELAETVRVQILDARTAEDLTAVWRDPEGIAAASSRAAVLTCGDENGVETSVLDLFKRAGEAIRAGSHLTAERDRGDDSDAAAPEPTETPGGPDAGTSEPGGVFCGGCGHPEDDCQCPAETAAEAPAPVPPVRRIEQALADLPATEARAELDKVMRSLWSKEQEQVLEWAKAQGLNPNHSAGNCATIVRAIADGTPFDDETLMARGEGSDDPVSLVMRVLGGVVVAQERAEDHVDAAHVNPPGRGSREDRAAAIEAAKAQARAGIAKNRS